MKEPRFEHGWLNGQMDAAGSMGRAGSFNRDGWMMFDALTSSIS
jgi:hypothetical protein